MKNCINLSFLILMLYCRSYAQEVKAPKMPVNEETKIFSYSKVVEVQGMDKGSLYDRAFAWLSAYYKNPADVLREKDRDAGSMIIKARFKISNTNSWRRIPAAVSGPVEPVP